MAGKIQLLSDEVIGKIAAGEVVERPAAAIKEMVENSLDAGATAITVEIRDGGISYFRVTDNGSGIQQSEIRMAFERHATSKISREQDLYAIQTLGFRGEALASIAAVAHVTCTTRTRSDVSGIRIRNSGGRIEAIEETACPEGTTFVVRDLFYNTPVRLKFLKKPVTEAGYVSDLMMRMILSRPDVSFRYISNGKTLYHSAGDGKLASAVFSIYGNELLRSMREVKGHEAGILLSGFVGVGDSGRATRAHQSFFINGRYMKSPVLSAALEAACRERVMSGKYPVCILHLTMPFDMVDVNVHPNKLECRFQNELALSAAVEAMIRDAFIEKSPLEKPEILKLTPDEPARVPVAVRKQEAAPAPVVPEVVKQKSVAVPYAEKPTKRPVGEGQTAKPASSHAPQASAEAVKADQQPVVPSVDTVTKPVAIRSTITVPPLAVQSTPRQMQPLQPVQSSGTPRHDAELSLNQTPVGVQAFRESSRISLPVMKAELQKAGPAEAKALRAVEQSFLPDAPKPLRIIGTAFNAYILVEYEDNLLLVDQQAVHERLLYDRMLKALDTHTCGQELLVPIIVSATRREQLLLEAHQKMLESIGLTVEAFGENEVSIRSIPMILGQPQAGDLLREVIDQLEGERGVISLEKRRAGILALACKRAVRKGERLTESDIRELVERMVEKKVTPASPRGTPLIVALPHNELDRRFRRMQ